MRFTQLLHDLGFSPLLSQERLDQLCAGTPVPTALIEVLDRWSNIIRIAQGTLGTVFEAAYGHDPILWDQNLVAWPSAAVTLRPLMAKLKADNRILCGAIRWWQPKAHRATLREHGENTVRGD